jgi:Lariat debranching enzyme, C-terminal domain
MHVKFAAEYGSTSFLALDKAIRPKEFIEILNIPGEAGLLTPDEEWLRLNRLTPSCQFEQYYPD